jgi:hypothetical protein
MSRTVSRFNDGSDAPPRLRLQHSFWGLSGLPMGGQEWSLEEKFARVKESGFEAVECWLGPDREGPVSHALKDAGLRLALGHHPFKLDDAKACVEQAKRLGADYVFAQPADAFTSAQDAVALIRDARAYAADQGVPYFIESHRNTVTETLPQTYDIIKLAPEVTFTADLSHYFVVGEFYGWENERLPERLGPILERTVSIHGRISNGEQVQVDVGDGTGRLPQVYVEIWSIAMKSFLETAQPGDVFPFTPELGPPSYAITHPDGSGEISDRWEQSLVMASLAKQAWERAIA